MSADDRKAFLLDGLRLERKPAGKSRPVKRISLKFLAIAGAMIVAASLYYGWPAAAVSVRAATAVAASGGAGSALDASGYVIARRQATLSAKILGKLVAVDVEEGERVAAGQVVARLDDSNYVAILEQSKASALVAEASLAQAKVAFTNAAPNYSRYRTLQAQGATSAEAVDGQKAIYDAARTTVEIAARTLAVARAAVAVAQANENDTIVRAPFTGVVTDKAAQPGEIVAPAAAGGGFTRTGIATIVDMDSLEIQVDVSESYIDRVHPGQKATVRLNAYPNWDIAASVIAVIPTADETKGSVKVRLGIATRDERILPQMGTRVSFLTNGSLRQTGVMIPAAAVMRRTDGAAVFVIGDDGRISSRSVEAGVARGNAVIIMAGLSPGERVATSDLGRLRDGSKVKVAP